MAMPGFGEGAPEMQGRHSHAFPSGGEGNYVKWRGQGPPFLFFFPFQFFSPFTSHDAIKQPLLTSSCMHAECRHCVSAAVLYYI